MEEPAKPSKTPPEQKQTPNQQAIEDLSWDVPFFRMGWNFFVREGKAVKNGWLAVLIMCGIVVFITYSCTSDCYKDKISEIKGELTDAKQDRDKYQTMLAPFQAAALKIYTNEPVQNGLDLLNKEITAISSTVSNSVFQQPYICLYINDQPITPPAHIKISKDMDRHIQFRVANLGRQTAQNINLSFASQIDPNLVSGWPKQGWAYVDGNPVPWNNWETNYTKSLPYFSFAYTAPIKFSAAFTNKSFQAEIAIWADNFQKKRMFYHI